MQRSYENNDRQAAEVWRNVHAPLLQSIEQSRLDNADAGHRAEARLRALYARGERERWAREVLAREAVLERMRNAQRQPDPAAAEETTRRPGQQPRQSGAGSDI